MKKIGRRLRTLITTTNSTIKDDGVGYTSDKSNSVKKMGLLGMKESVTCIGGTFDIKGKTGKGTLVSVRCPKISYVRKVV